MASRSPVLALAMVGDILSRNVSVPHSFPWKGWATGAGIVRTAAPVFKNLALEIGGKNPSIVFADADPYEAMAGAVMAAFGNQGQISLCGSRIFVEHDVYSDFVGGFVANTKRLVIGDPHHFVFLLHVRKSCITVVTGKR